MATLLTAPAGLAARGMMRLCPRCAGGWWGGQACRDCAWSPWYHRPTGYLPTGGPVGLRFGAAQAWPQPLPRESSEDDDSAADKAGISEEGPENLAALPVETEETPRDQARVPEVAPAPPAIATAEPIGGYDVAVVRPQAPPVLTAADVLGYLGDLPVDTEGRLKGFRPAIPDDDGAGSPPASTPP